MATSSLPTRTLAGIAVPDTPLITAAIELARNHLNDMTYNHIMRCYLLGLAIADRLPPLQDRDRKPHALAAILHDLGWDTNNTFVSEDKRFEVDGANAARSFVQREAASCYPPGWDRHRLQLLWDAIALHTTPSIPRHKELEVVATGLGIFADFGGVDAVPGTITQQEWEAVVTELPRQ